MSEQMILELIPRRMKQLEYRTWDVRYRDLMLKAGTNLHLDAFNQLWFIIDDPQGLKVESDYGLYDTASGDFVFENSHMHKGQLVITNPETVARKIKFIQVTIIN